MDVPTSSEYQEDKALPQCKIKRNYSCSHCLYFTQNPRFYLTHLRDVHGEKITISNCSLCLYASRHYQKLVRHMKMVHGSTAEGIPGQTRKRPLIEDVVSDSTAISPLPTPYKWIIDINNLSYDLKSSRKTLKDIAAIYFAENDIEEILTKMEASDVVEVVPARDVIPSGGVSSQTVFGDPRYVGAEDMDITCPCGHVSKCLVDLIQHGKFCSESKGDNYESTPLDLSIRSSNKDDSTSDLTNGIKKEEGVDMQDDSKKHQLTKFDNFWKIAEENLIKDNLKVYKHRFDHSKKLENKPIEEKGRIEKIEPHDIEMVNSRIIPKEVAKPLATHKKVFKCPLCPFWASTASRFHVHIVGHQNKKPFKCSLCAYCSNWRWDITKHIRLRTLRSPSHKNARVLMQGENGRRNYTKYDRFITLIKTSEHDGDFKLKKCGEMTLNDDPKITSCELDEDLIERTHDDNETKGPQKLNSNSEKSEIPRALTSPPEVVKNNNCSRIASRQCNPRTYLILEDGDKPAYKCSKCNFRHPNRDAVLVHVKIHHHELLKSSISSSKTTAEIYEDSKMKVCEEVKRSTEIETNQPLKNIEKSTLGDDENDDTVTVSTPKNDNSSMKNPTTTPLTSPVKDSLENNDMTDLLVSDMASSSYNENHAPFRCWHCHQVSNWKHVIQRHCRLKHSGSIRIEAIDRSIDANNPIYRILNLSSSSEVLPAIQIENKTKELCTNHTNTKILNRSIDSDTELSTKMHDIILEDSKKSQHNNVTRAESKSLKFECKDCPYVCTNKIQLNKHYAQKHKPSSIVRKKSQKSCTKEKAVNSTSVSAEKCEVPIENDMTLQKCHYCSFESSCRSAMESHEQNHYKVLNQKNSQIQKLKNIEEGTNSDSEKIKVVTEALDHPTSNVNTDLGVTVEDNNQKIESSLTTENKISLKKGSEMNCQIDKMDKEIQLKVKNKKTTSSVNLSSNKVMLNPPAQSNRKTIFVNPKTGQIVRRN